MPLWQALPFTWLVVEGPSWGERRMSSSLTFAPASALHMLRFPAFPDTHALESRPAVSEFLPQASLLMAVPSGTHNAPARNRRALQYVFMGQKQTHGESATGPRPRRAQAKAPPLPALWRWANCGPWPASVAIFIFYFLLFFFLSCHLEEGRGYRPPAKGWGKD